MRHGTGYLMKGWTDGQEFPTLIHSLNKIKLDNQMP
jgi:hypothetical protein